MAHAHKLQKKYRWVWILLTVMIVLSMIAPMLAGSSFFY